MLKIEYQLDDFQSEAKNFLRQRDFANRSNEIRILKSDFHLFAEFKIVLNPHKMMAYTKIYNF